MYNQNKSIAYFLWILIGYFLLGSFLSQWIGGFLVKQLYGVEKIESFIELGKNFPNAWFTMRWIQLIHTVLSFLLPAWWVRREYLSQNTYSTHNEVSSVIGTLVIVPVLLLSLMPLIQWLYGINQNIYLPPSINEWVKNMDLKNSQMLMGMFADKSWQAISLNFFIIAIVASLSEELFFRGVLQRLLTDRLNPHIAILFSSFCFSAIHFQFIGFLPRWGMGIFLGYLFWHTHRLIVPIFAHFLFNGGQLLLYYFFTEKNLMTNFEPSKSISGYLVFISTIVFIFTYLISKNLLFQKKYRYLE
ncbi:MAG: CPBP family intramembrane metalloprotease [Chitinophagales bacterium]|nr:CPBP family intramembrane metalloprotease [Chitinophagales bacterium]MCZ2394836.1 CPBP family intramembrane metalloprotease [Chitinophagales bacterium]